MMQIYADVCGKTIHICTSRQSCALGSAILGASAATQKVTGCRDIPQLMDKYVKPSNVVYVPNPERKACYDCLYNEYLHLSDTMAAQDSIFRKIQKVDEK